MQNSFLAIDINLHAISKISNDKLRKNPVIIPTNISVSIDSH